jgi:hypothetical protein
MVYKKIVVLFLILLFSISIKAQQENVPLDHDVYTFLKEMKVKGILDQIHDDNPNMSRYEVKKHLEKINSNIPDLSSTEKKILKKYQDEFYDDLADSTNTFQMFGKDAGFSTDYSELFSDKIKHMYAFRKDKANFYLEMLGRYMHGQVFKPRINNSELFDVGFRGRGTLFGSLGYSMTVQKGGVLGSQEYAPTFDPRLNYNFKFVEAIENIGNYDFVEGYIRYYSEPIEDMKLSFEIGREKIKLGYGYGSKLVLSGDHPYLDMLRMDFNYGIVSYTSIAASIVGNYSPVREENYTKYIAYNKVKLSFENIGDLGIGEVIIYSGRGLDFAYLNPFAFYKYEEMSLQDRDNGLVFLDFQTNVVKNLEVQGTFFLDEDILSNLQDFELYKNKTAYQLSALWYSPFSISDLSLAVEYTKIRPYVYSHNNSQDTYTAWNQCLGHRIGPNADEIYAKLSYNFSGWLRGNFEYQHVRSGENIYDGLGNVLFNSGGDIFFPYRDGIDSEHINTLDGDKVNQNILTLSFRAEPIREVYFDLLYRYIQKHDLAKDITEDTSIAFLKMTFEF